MLFHIELYLCSISAMISVYPYPATGQQARQVDPHQLPKVPTPKDLQATLPTHLQGQVGAC